MPKRERPALPLVFTGGSRPKGRKGQACRRVPRDDPKRYRTGQGVEHVEFADGARFVVDTRQLERGRG